MRDGLLAVVICKIPLVLCGTDQTGRLIASHYGHRNIYNGQQESSRRGNTFVLCVDRSNEPINMTSKPSGLS